MQTKIRLDPPSGVYKVRGYDITGDPSIPLHEEMRPYCMVGDVIIAGHVAVGSMLNGDLSDPGLWIDFDAALRARGVTELHWQRHKNGRVLTKKRRVKP